MADSFGISNYRKRHGLLFSKDMADPFIDLIVWQRHREEPYCHAKIPNNDPAELLLSACRTLFSRRQLALHKWAERMARGYTNNTGYQIWLGAGSSGKSHMAGLFALLDYVASFGAAADDISGSMYGMLVSTNKEALSKRSLASAVEYLGYLRSGSYGVPFKFLSQKFAILPETVGDENVASFKARLDGVALAEGSETEAKGKVIGVHLPRIRIIADEFENLSESRASAFMSAQVNLQAGCSDYKCLFLFNPQNRSLPGSRLAEPLEGWTSIDFDTYSWISKSGMHVERFDAEDSPGVEDPKAYPFLPTREYINKIAKEKGEDHPDYWAFVRAFPPTDLGARTVISPDMVAAWGMTKPVEWEYPPDVFASLDPAFTADGDDCVLQRAWIGRERNTSRAVICFDPDYYVIPISATSGVPVLQQIGMAAKEKLEEWGVPAAQFACDDSGTQSVADYMEIIGFQGLYRCNYSLKPPQIPMSVNPQDSVDKRYRNTVTWMYYLINEYGKYGQIKGLSSRAADEFCSRQLDKKLKGLLIIETKKAFKRRNKDGRSPDVADCDAMIAGMARHRFGFIPGTNSWSGPGLPKDEWYDEEANPMAGLAKEYNNMNSLDSAGRY